MFRRRSALKHLLDDTLGESDHAALIGHLDRCEACTNRLEQLAADDQFWQVSAKSLRIDDQLPVDDTSTDQLSKDDAVAAIPLSPVLKSLLAPSEDPYSLGRVGRFEILGVVGSGGMGTVLKARDVDIDRIVALKLPATHLMDSPTALERIEREARSAATIRHPSIIEIYQVERWREIPYLVMPYHKGPSLTARLSSDGPMDLLESIRVARQTAEVLAAAHEHGVVHRDVKPGNILLGKGTERAVLTDFGIAKIQSDAQVTATGVIVGTPAFLSPEQASGEEATPQSDLFSLGSVLWSMLAGRPPFVDLPTHTVVAAIGSGKLPKLHDVRTDLPRWAYRLVDWLHQVAPIDRPESSRRCTEVLRSCEQHLLDPLDHPLPMVLATETKSNRSRHVLLSFVAMSVCTATITLMAMTPVPAKKTRGYSPPPMGGQEDSMLDSLSQTIDGIDSEMTDLIIELEQIAEAKRTDATIPGAEQ